MIGAQLDVQQSEGNIKLFFFEDAYQEVTIAVLKAVNGPPLKYAK